MNEILSESDTPVNEWHPIGTAPDTRPILVLNSAGYAWTTFTKDLTRASATHWAPLPTMPAPDPMTIAAWHPIETLPESGWEWVLLKRESQVGHKLERWIEPHARWWKAIASLDTAVAWCPFEPAVALIPEVEEALHEQ